MKILFLILLSIALLASAQAEPSQKSVNSLLHQIRSRLPTGWSVTYDPKNTWLEVSTDHEIKGYSAGVNLPGGPQPAEYEKYLFAFDVSELLSPAQFHRLNGENAKLHQEINALENELIRKLGVHKSDYSSRVPEEKVQIRRYEPLKKSLHTLPDYYYGSISLEWAFNSPDNPKFAILDDRLQAQANAVRQKVIDLFSPYEKKL